MNLKKLEKRMQAHMKAADNNLAGERDWSRYISDQLKIQRRLTDALMSDLIEISDCTLSHNALTIDGTGGGIVAPLGMQREEIIKILEAAIVTAEDGEQADRKTVQTITTVEAEQHE